MARADIYKDQSIIGVGGFSKVCKCIRVRDNRLFAKKTPKPDADDETITRFKREVRLLSSLDHPNVIKVVHSSFKVKPYFYIMPYYKESLQEVIPSLERDPDRIRSIFGRVLDAVEYAHMQGVVHRDLKPRNILMNNDADVVASDFGLGRHIDSDSARVTRSGEEGGTHLYMAPEQFTDFKNADERSDIFSLGRILLELYMGYLSTAIQDTSGLPPGIRFIVEHCTYTDPNRRFQTVSDLKQSWMGLLDREHRKSEIDELELLVAECAAPGAVSDRSAQRLVELLAKYGDDDDFLHETLMHLHPQALRAMSDVDPAVVGDLIARFCKFTAGQPWAFHYTDEIANWCRGVFKFLPSADIRGDILVCLLQVGVGHSRFHVLNVFGVLLQSTDDPGEELVFADKLAAVDEDIRLKAKSQLSAGGLHPDIRKLFGLDKPDK